MHVLLSLVIQQVDKDLSFIQEEAVDKRRYKVRVDTRLMIDWNNILKILFLNYFMLVKDDNMERPSIKIRNSKDNLLIMILNILDTDESPIELDILRNSIIDTIVNSDTVLLKRTFG